MTDQETKDKPNEASCCHDRIQELRNQIADIKKRWPAHSTPPALMIQLDDLEEELENELRKNS